MPTCLVICGCRSFAIGARLLPCRTDSAPSWRSCNSLSRRHGVWRSGATKWFTRCCRVFVPSCTSLKAASRALRTTACVRCPPIVVGRPLRLVAFCILFPNVCPHRHQGGRLAWPVQITLDGAPPSKIGQPCTSCRTSVTLSSRRFHCWGPSSGPCMLRNAGTQTSCASPCSRTTTGCIVSRLRKGASLKTFRPTTSLRGRGRSLLTRAPVSKPPTWWTQSRLGHCSSQVPR
mmetsp:Transcript_23523/g.61888  ORF Transcript_23523/g.61888 Transcript_23523/m.61888 type:complete len:232 (+) Transcript_23523:595-1290(+)